MFKTDKKKAGMAALNLLGGTKAAAAELGKDSEFLKAAEQGTTEITEISTEPTNETELYEAYSTIKVLKSELNEINLLNAKLLYTNKIFKAKNLNESQKVKVLTSFDRAKNVGEVKMVFETLNEGIKVSKNIIKENLGRASKGTITPNVKKPIVESNEAFLRMQKLAGII
jgi:transposase